MPLYAVQLHCCSDLSQSSACALTGPGHASLRPGNGTTTYLAPSILSSHGQPHGMSPPPIRSCILQPCNISQHLPPQVVLDFHVCERGIDFENLIVGQLANTAGIVEMVSGE